MDHQHLLIKAYVNKPMKDIADLDFWLRQTVKAIDMKILMGPYCRYLDVTGNRGITGVVVIETSHIACHMWDEVSPALLQMDVYSCKKFNPVRIIERLAPFEIVHLDVLEIDRNQELRSIP